MRPVSICTYLSANPTSAKVQFLPRYLMRHMRYTGSFLQIAVVVTAGIVRIPPEMWGIVRMPPETWDIVRRPLEGSSHAYVTF